MQSLKRATFWPVFAALYMTVAAAPACSAAIGTWTTLTKLPQARQEHSTVAINDSKIVVIGGTAAGASTDLVHMYDIAAATWSTKTPVPFKVNHPNVASCNGKIYVLGGLIGANIPWSASGESYAYDPVADSWTKLESMPSGTERGSAIVGVYGEMIYLAGGMTVLQIGNQNSVTTVNGFNTTSGKWQTLPAAAANIPEGRQHGAGAVIGDVFYITGGRTVSQTAVRGDVFMLNLTNQSTGWQNGSSKMPVPRGGISGAVIGTQIVTFGGEGNPNSASGVFNQTESFDVATQQWAELTPMAVPRHGTSAVAVGGKIYIPGGGLQQDGKPWTNNGVTSYGTPSDQFDVFTL